MTHRTLIVIQAGSLIATAALVLVPLAAGQDANRAPKVLGTLPMMSFLWLILTGYFGYGTADRRDWIALPPFFWPCSRGFQGWRYCPIRGQAPAL